MASSMTTTVVVNRPSSSMVEQATTVAKKGGNLQCTPMGNTSPWLLVLHTGPLLLVSNEQIVHDQQLMRPTTDRGQQQIHNG